MSLSDVLSVLSAIGVALLLALIGALKGGVQKAAETSAEKGAEEAIKRVTWPNELARALEQVRGESRQELRFTSYGALWTRMRPLALYDVSTFDSAAAARL